MDLTAADGEVHVKEHLSSDHLGTEPFNHELVVDLGLVGLRCGSCRRHGSTTAIASSLTSSS